MFRCEADIEIQRRHRLIRIKRRRPFIFLCVIGHDVAAGGPKECHPIPTLVLSFAKADTVDALRRMRDFLTCVEQILPCPVRLRFRHAVLCQQILTVEENFAKQPPRRHRPDMFAARPFSFHDRHDFFMEDERTLFVTHPIEIAILLFIKRIQKSLLDICVRLAEIDIHDVRRHAARNRHQRPRIHAAPFHLNAASRHKLHRDFFPIKCAVFVWISLITRTILFLHDLRISFHKLLQYRHLCTRVRVRSRRIRKAPCDHRHNRAANAFAIFLHDVTAFDLSAAKRQGQKQNDNEIQPKRFHKNITNISRAERNGIAIARFDERRETRDESQRHKTTGRKTML